VTLNLGALAIWIAAFAGVASATALTVAGYALILAGWLPPLVLVLRRLFASPGSPPDREESITTPASSSAPGGQPLLGR
jgi:hypothetical protein